MDKVSLEAKIAAQSEKNGPSIQHIEKNLEPLKNIYWLYLLADKNKKRLLLKSISSNLLLTGGKIVITPKSPFDLLLNHNPLPHCDHSWSQNWNMKDNISSDENFWWIDKELNKWSWLKSEKLEKFRLDLLTSGLINYIITR